MLKKIMTGMWVGTALASLTACAGWFGFGEPQYLSPTLVLPSGEKYAVFVTEATASRIVETDIVAGKVLRTIKTAQPPTGLARDAQHNLLFVTTDGPDGEIFAFDLTSDRKAFELDTAGHTPMAPVLTADGKTLFVCYRFNNVVAVFDLEAKKEIARIAVPREPVAAALTPDGRLLAVANHLPAVPASGPTAVITVDTLQRSPEVKPVYWPVS